MVQIIYSVLLCYLTDKIKILVRKSKCMSSFVPQIFSKSFLLLEIKEWVLLELNEWVLASGAHKVGAL